VQLHEPFALRGLEVRDAKVLERVVPAVAPFGRHALRDGVRDLVLVAGAPHELDELRLRQPDLGEQRRAQAGCEMIVAQVPAAQRSARLVDRPRQEHEARESRAWIARRAPAQADRAHGLRW
jgi:hypothetical protein